MISFIGLSDQNDNLSSFSYMLITIVIVVLAYLLYQSYFSGESRQRLYAKPQLPSGKEFQVFTMDAIGDRSEMFIIGIPQNTNFKSIYSSKDEEQKVKKEAHQFFKTHFGLSDSFLLTYMYPIVINSKLGYHLQYSQSVPGYQGKIQDGGYTCYVPKGQKMYGQYGGSIGVAFDRDAILIYGHYLVGDKYRIRYWSSSPIKTYKSFDGDYTPVDCDVEIEHAPEARLIGLKGKSHGIYIKKRLVPDQKKPMEKDHIIIRNVLTFR
jgi:hypothetical protein